MKKNEKSMSSLENQKQNLTNVKGGKHTSSQESSQLEMTQQKEALDDLKPVPGRPVSATVPSSTRISVKTSE